MAINGKVTIKAFAVASGFPPSPTVTFTYRYDPNFAKLTGKDSIPAVISEMSLSEKISLLGGSTSIPLSGAAGATQKIERLGIPATSLSNGPAGLKINANPKGYPMHWPNEAARAATWNTKLLDQMGSAWGQEMFYFGSDLLLATCLNIQRHPLGGRNFEYYSEDPYLTGKVAAAEINGIQSQGVGATIKHLFAYDQETNRMNLPVQLSTRAAREIYLPGYEIAIKESNPWAMMTSYNSTNGVATAQNPELIAQIVRGEWGFDGISMTDWGGYGNLLYWPATQAGSNAYSGLVKAGNDLCMNTGSATDVKAGLDAGFITQADIDACVQRILEFVVKTPAFKGNSKSSAPDTDKNMDLAVDVAVEAMTLLKNEKVNEISALPIKSSEVTMIGTTASALFRGGKGSGGCQSRHEPNVGTP